MARMGKLKPLRGTASNLANIVLENGEVAFDYLPENTYGDYGIKMGDGTTVYSELPYLIKRTKGDPDPWEYDEGTDEAALLNNIKRPDQETIGKIYYIQSYMNGGRQYYEYTPTIQQDVPYKVIDINHDGTENTVDLMSCVAVNYLEFIDNNKGSWIYGKYTTSKLYNWLPNTCATGYSDNIKAKMVEMTERWREATGNATGTMMSRSTKCKLLNPVELFGYSAATYDPRFEYPSSSDHKTDFANPAGNKYGSLYPVWNDSISALTNRRVFHDKAMSITTYYWTNSWLGFGKDFPYAYCFIVRNDGSCYYGDDYYDYYTGGVAPVIRLSY